MSFSLGRPFTLDASEITVRKPSASFSPSHGTWRAYPPPPPTTPQVYSKSFEVGSRETPDLIGVISEHRIKLCDLVEPIARALSVFILSIALWPAQPTLTAQIWQRSNLDTRTTQHV